MPTDENGVMADVVIVAQSAVNRMNVPRGHEQLIGAAGRDCIKDMRTMFKLDERAKLDYETSFNAVMKASNPVKENAFNHLLGIYKIISPTRVYPIMKEAFEQRATDEWWLDHLVEVMLDGNDPYGLFIQNPVGSEIEWDEVVDELSTGKYKPRITPVTYTDMNGISRTTKSSMLIGPNYYLGLEKTATDGNGVSVSRVNQFGISSKLTNTDKYMAPVRETGTKHIGESEYRNLAKSLGGDFVSLVSDLNNDPATTKQAALNLIGADKPTNIDLILDPDLYKGRHRVRHFTLQHMYTGGKVFIRPDSNEEK